ncbi:MAG TPA: hypothetical protein VFD41_04910 [Actinomycetales bacterium]|nr:hypothetical protein [Actinomycetales bacterium]
MGTHVQVLRGRYHDSVTLLATSRAVASVAGVGSAQVAMATPLNLEVLESMGFTAPAASPDDLVVALRLDDDLLHRGTDDEGVVAAAMAAMEAALTRRPSSGGGAVEEPDRTTAAALRRAAAPLVLVSVPGEHAAAEAWDALDAGSSVMLFSDNVAVADEVALKREAARRGLLVMGPDCGTAVVGGVGLGFANAVRPGPVSLVAASGTGAQHLMCLLDAAGVGVRHCLGLGGRDLSADVGGLAAAQSLRMLADDDGTELVVLVSKPADGAVVERLASLASELRLTVEWAVLGAGRPDLTEVASTLCDRVGSAVPTWPSWRPAGTPAPSTAGLLRGLYSGGTLCDEALAVGSLAGLGPIASNVAFDPGWPRLDASGPRALAASLADAGHAMVDLGDDTLTRGRAHPMIDPSLRLEALADAAADPRVRVVLLDVVLGHGSHPDPAAELAPAVSAALKESDALDVVLCLVGTADDPQGTTGQAEVLAAAGAHVLASNAQATRLAAALASGTPAAGAEEGS